MRDTDFLRRPPSAALLIAFLLTVVAIVAHHFIPQRRLSLQAATEGAVYFLLEDTDHRNIVQWIDRNKFRYQCNVTAPNSGQGCAFYFLLSQGAADHGTDLRHYQNLTMKLHYSGAAHFVRISIRNFDKRFSTAADANSSKINTINLHPRDLSRPVSIDLTEFNVPEWWLAQYDIPRTYAYRDMSNATALSVDLLGNIEGHHEIWIDQIEFSGEWVSAENWYLGILSLWILAGLVYGLLHVMALRGKFHHQRDKLQNLVERNVALRTEKERYQRLSTIDALTTVLNRHGIDQYIASIPDKHACTSVILIDLDHFKKINDERGHNIGDHVLQRVGLLLADSTRDTDGLGRWGGEEFVLVCPDLPLTSAVELAEKLRQLIKSATFPKDETLAVTASFGVATRTHEQSFEEAINQADYALYQAKHRGRNCVVAAKDDHMHAMTGAGKGAWAQISGRFKIMK